MKRTFFAAIFILFFTILFSCQSPIDLLSDPGIGPEKAAMYVPTTRLNMTSKDAYEQDDSTTYAKTITVNATPQEHNFYDDAKDYMKFTAVAGTTYVIETIVYGYADTVLYLLDGTTTIASNDDKGDGTYGSKITWTASSSKTYYILSYSYNGRYGTNRGYTISLTSNGGGGSGITLPQPKKSWTILVYLDADNNLSSYGDYDINEMKAVGSDSNINIVVLWDNAGSTHGYYYIQTTGAILLKDVGEVNMGSETTAKNFIDYATLNFPADHYMWIFWNHGGAVDRSLTPKGVCWDDTNSSDHLSEVEQKSIISYLNSKTGKMLDVLAYDACLMACAELIYQFRGMASYLASSEQTIPGNGYDYRFISYIKNNPTTTAYYAAKAIFDYYKSTYSTTSDVTFSVVNLSYASNLGTALNNFATAAKNSGISGTTFKNLKPTSSFSGYTWDLYVYMNNIYNNSSITTTVKNYAKAVMDLVNPANAQLVVLEWHGSTWTGKAYGVSITLKSDTTIYQQLDICIDTQWNEFLTFAGF
ncbi:MAG: clostripain-related cysteine peptidase [Exilispira sp.]